MATVYSLVCWGGRTGKNVTLTIASPCVVTSTNHGLRDGAKLVFSTSGALPTGITPGVTYYAKGVAANTFNLYMDEALTNIVNTSGSQSGTHTAKSKLMLDYFAQYPGRWGDSGSERCYNSIVSWHSARTGAGVSSLDSEVCELGQAFVDIISDMITPTISMAAASIEIVSKIAGARTEAFHYGQSGSGYELYRNSSGYNLLNVSTPRTTIDGFSVTAFATYGGNQAIYMNRWGSVARNMLVSPGSDTTTTDGIYLASAVQSVVNCRITGCLRGILVIYTHGLLVANNTVTGCGTGISAAVTGINGEYYNNVSIGNKTNWGAITYNSGMTCAGNAGLAGEAWYTGSAKQITVSTTDFVSFPTDMRPALSTSPQVDAGVEYYGIYSTDIADAERPNYNNGGSEAFDIGCYEFDHGYGLHPATLKLTLAGVVAGSEVRIYAVSDGTELAGTESCASNPTFTFTANVQVRILVISTTYKLIDFVYSAGSGIASIPIEMSEDPWFKDPL